MKFFSEKLATPFKKLGQKLGLGSNSLELPQNASVVDTFIAFESLIRDEGFNKETVGKIKLAIKHRFPQESFPDSLWPEAVALFLNHCRSILRETEKNEIFVQFRDERKKLEGARESTFLSYLRDAENAVLNAEKNPN